MGKKFLTICTILILFMGAVQAQPDSRSLRLENSVEIYPNPAVEFLNVEINDAYMEHVEFEMHSIIGNKIRITPEKIASNQYRIHVKDLATGYYFLVVKDEFLRFKKAYKFLKN